MHEGAVGAVFVTLVVVAERAAAIGAQGIKRAIAKHAIENFALGQRMAGIIGAFLVGKHALIFPGYLLPHQNPWP